MNKVLPIMGDYVRYVPPGSKHDSFAKLLGDKVGIVQNTVRLGDGFSTARVKFQDAGVFILSTQNLQVLTKAELMEHFDIHETWWKVGLFNEGDTVLIVGPDIQGSNRLKSNLGIVKNLCCENGRRVYTVALYRHDKHSHGEPEFPEASLKLLGADRYLTPGVTVRITKSPWDSLQGRIATIAERSSSGYFVYIDRVGKTYVDETEIELITDAVIPPGASCEGSESITFVEDEGSDTVIRMKDGDLCCEWVNLNEGYSGDYDPNDPDDENLLRFDIYRRPADFDDEWDIKYEEPNASFCTMMPADADQTILVAALRYIIAKYKEALTADPRASMKKIGEKLSYVSPDLFEKVPAQCKPHRELAGNYMVIPTMEASTWEEEENNRCIPHDADIPVMYFAVKKDTILAYLHLEDEGSGPLAIKEWLEDEDTDFEATNALLNYGLLMGGVAFTFCKEREIPLEAVDVSDKDSTLALMDFLSRELREDGYDDASDHLNYLYDFRTQKPEILLNSEDF